MKKRRIIGIGFGVFAAGVYLANASWLAGVPEGQMSVLAHRGVHQTYHREGLTNTTCTAARIDEPSHGFIENTLPSMQAAILAGADIIELDIHITTDSEFVVFHDWTLDCRTDGQGRTRDFDLKALKALDIGYGYTADAGQSFPFRGKFVGAMPTLKEVLASFPDTEFQINIKSKSIAEAKAFLEYVPAQDWPRLGLTAHKIPAKIVRAAHPEMVAQSRQNVKNCLKNYALTGWFGNMPKACHNNQIPVPANYRRLIWGWPHRYEKRLNAVGSRSLLMGPFDSNGMVGLDEISQLGIVPKDFKGIVFTNKIEVVGPELKSR